MIKDCGGASFFNIFNKLINILINFQDNRVWYERDSFWFGLEHRGKKKKKNKYQNNNKRRKVTEKKETETPKKGGPLWRLRLKPTGQWTRLSWRQL